MTSFAWNKNCDQKKVHSCSLRPRKTKKRSTETRKECWNVSQEFQLKKQLNMTIINIANALLQWKHHKIDSSAWQCLRLRKCVYFEAYLGRVCLLSSRLCRGIADHPQMTFLRPCQAPSRRRHTRSISSGMIWIRPDARSRWDISRPHIRRICTQSVWKRKKKQLTTDR